jgi:hypothetical protein
VFLAGPGSVPGPTPVLVSVAAAAAIAAAAAAATASAPDPSVRTAMRAARHAPSVPVVAAS